MVLLIQLTDRFITTDCVRLMGHPVSQCKIICILYIQKSHSLSITFSLSGSGILLENVCLQDLITKHVYFTRHLAERLLNFGALVCNKTLGNILSYTFQENNQFIKQKSIKFGLKIRQELLFFRRL